MSKTNPAKPIPSVAAENRIAKNLELFNRDFPLIFIAMIYTGKPYDAITSITKNELLSYSLTVKNGRKEKVLSLPKHLVSQIRKHPAKNDEVLFNKAPTLNPFRYALNKVSAQLNAAPVITLMSIRKTFIYHLYLDEVNLANIRPYCLVTSYKQLNEYLHIDETYIGETIINRSQKNTPKQPDLQQRLQNVAALLSQKEFDPTGNLAKDLEKCLKKHGY